ncbi:REP-associated tyrosine transposase [Pseudomonas abieticivorans]|uniref:REP-associated tyrosine transposase n=1 Tax=Pseudomonas abieticivorans TaxID=2931382 RepID=UPI0020BEFC05|nr:transposase [Pseudomonas sp. PIA16]
MPLYTAKNLRQGRFSEHGRIHLVTTVIQHREAIFRDWQTARGLIEALKLEHDDGIAESNAWVIMPDHLHWLVQLRAGTLGDLLRRIKAHSSHSINRHLGRSGPLWQKGYHDRALRKEDDIKVAARYIIANPLRAGLVKHIGDYPLWDAKWL